MSYSEYKGSTAARPFRIILGGALTLTCCSLGFLLMTHEYHQALMMQEQPEELDWQTLADRGPVDNAFIRLTDVELDLSDPLDELADMFGDFQPDPDGDAEEALELFVDSMDEVNPLQMVQMAVSPVKVIPKGADKDDTPDVIVIERVDKYVNEAKRQLEETGTLSGFVTYYYGDQFVRAILKHADDDMADAFDEMVPDQKVYVIQPMSKPLDRSAAAWSFWGCGLGFALGLIICGSGGPVLSTCVYWTLPSIISLLGYPMRYGRGGNVTRAIYLLIGCGLLYYAYQIMIVHGQFGHIDGIAIFHSIGFVLTFVGMAAVLATPAQILSRKFESSLDVAPTPNREVKMSVADACSLKPVDVVETVYRDRHLFDAESDESPDNMRRMTDALTRVGFNPAQLRCWQLSEHAQTPAAIQLGCQDMVVCDLDSVDGRLESRMVSVLHDGMTIVTLSPVIKAGADRRVGSNGAYQRSKSDDPETMLSMHLETTIGIAEKRDTSVVTFDADELDQVSHLARRVLVDIQYQYGETEIEVDAGIYGRFRYPAQPIPESVGA